MSFIESNTGTSNYFAGMDRLFYSSNVFFADQNSRIASLFPLLLLIVVIIFALIDFGAVGVTIGGIVGLLAGHFLGIMPLSLFYLVSFVCMAGLLIYKLAK